MPEGIIQPLGGRINDDWEITLDLTDWQSPSLHAGAEIGPFAVRVDLDGDGFHAEVGTKPDNKLDLVERAVREYRDADDSEQYKKSAVGYQPATCSATREQRKGRGKFTASFKR